MKKIIVISLCLAAILLGVGSALLLWEAPAPLSQRSSERPQVKSGVVSTVHNSHQPAVSYATTGDVALDVSGAPSLMDAISHTTRLGYTLRLKLVHAARRELGSRPPTPAQLATLRSFISDPGVPEGLNIQQLRALKNDVLNVLCHMPGEEHATAVTLRSLYADETADPGLRDYALQHLVTLIERDPSLGWSSHLHAIESNNPALAATALIHLSAQLRKPAPPSSTPATHRPLRPIVSSAAVRLASDPTSPSPVRATALQICSQLQLPEAHQIAFELASSEQTSMPLRIAAVAAIGNLNRDKDTQSYLRGLSTGAERRLRAPALSALSKNKAND